MRWTSDSSTIPYIFDPDSLQFQRPFDESSSLHIRAMVHKQLEDEARAHTLETIGQHDGVDAISTRPRRLSPPVLETGLSFSDPNPFSNEFINGIWVEAYRPSLEQHNDSDLSDLHDYMVDSPISTSFIHDDDMDYLAVAESYPGNEGTSMDTDAFAPPDSPSHNGCACIAGTSLPDLDGGEFFECRWQNCGMRLFTTTRESKRAIILNHLEDEHYLSAGPCRRRPKVCCSWDFCVSKKRYHIGMTGIVQHITRTHGND